MKKCPYCAEEIQDEATVCRYCGKELTKHAGMRVCQHCLKLIPAYMKVCKYCGEYSEGGYQDVQPPQNTEPIEPKPPVKRSFSGYWPLIAVVLILAGGIWICNNGSGGSEKASSSSLSCADQSMFYRPKLTDVAERWDDANKIASATSRIALAVPVSNLQAIYRETQALNPPACANNLQYHFVTYMDYTIEGYLAFMAQEDDKTVNSWQEKASKEFDLFSAEVDRIY